MRGKQRVTGFGAGEAVYLDAILDWYRRDGLRCSIQINYAMNRKLFGPLASAGRFSGSATMVAWMDAAETNPSVPDLVIRESPPDERQMYLDLLAGRLPTRPRRRSGYGPIQWAEDALPGGKRYIAELAGRPAAFASLLVIEGVAMCGTAGTLPEFRGRGIQQAPDRRTHHRCRSSRLFHAFRRRRIRATAYRNFARRGFRMIPLGMKWADTFEGTSSP